MQIIETHTNASKSLNLDKATHVHALWLRVCYLNFVNNKNKAKKKQLHTHIPLLQANMFGHHNWNRYQNC